VHCCSLMNQDNCLSKNLIAKTTLMLNIYQRQILTVNWTSLDSLASFTFYNLCLVAVAVLFEGTCLLSMLLLARTFGKIAGALLLIEPGLLSQIGVPKTTPDAYSSVSAYSHIY
jgi:hypothetical protein